MKIILRKTPTAGFTLIELLVVVSIISILSIIAVPNFQEAQTRAKIAATQNNMRNLATKFELIQVDYNRYPAAGKWRQILHWHIPEEFEGNTPDEKFIAAYKSLYGPHEDLFESDALKRIGVRERQWLGAKDGQYFNHGFNFFHPQTMIEAINLGSRWQGQDIKNWEVLSEHAGGWVIYSPGPDLVINSPETFDVGWCRGDTGDKNYVEKMLFHEYDPTNGTISYGNIFRTQRNTAGLGFHSHFYE